MASNRPLQYAVYKGMSGKFGAAQFNFQPAHFYKDRDKDFTGKFALDAQGKLLEDQGWKQREGAVFIEVAPPLGGNKYDWEQGKKITMALSVTDMGKIVHHLSSGTECKIMHDPGAKTATQGAVKKYLNLSSPEGIMTRGTLLSLSQDSGGDKNNVTVPLSPDECIVVRQLLLTAISRALQWE